MKKLLVESYEIGEKQHFIVGPCIADILAWVKNEIVDSSYDEELDAGFANLVETFKDSDKSLDDLVKQLRKLPLGDVMGDFEYRFQAIEVPDIEVVDKLVFVSFNEGKVNVIGASIDTVKKLITELYSDPDVDPEILADVAKYMKKKKPTLGDGIDLIYAYYEQTDQPYPYVFATNVR